MEQKFLVVVTGSSTLLGAQAAQELGLKSIAEEVYMSNTTSQAVAEKVRDCT